MHLLASADAFACSRSIGVGIRCQVSAPCQSQQ